MSDLHGHLPARVPPCDLLILSGDIGPDVDQPFSATNAYRQLSWFNTTFAAWLHNVHESGTAEEVVATPGNHDFGLFRVRFGLGELPWHLLIDQEVELFGFKIWGSPWVGGTIDNQWAFRLDEEILKVRWSRIPEDTDILVLHSPPRGILDLTDTNENVGSVTLRERLDGGDGLLPKLVTFGHIHESYGTVERNGGVYLNASHVNSRYIPTNPAHVVLLDRPVSSEVISAQEDTVATATH